MINKTKPSKFNKGEWSEFYVFIKLLSNKKIYLFDDKLNKSESFYEVIKIIRNELEEASYLIDKSKINKIISNKTIEIDINKIRPFVDVILSDLRNKSGASFSIKDTDTLLKTNHIKLGSSYVKSDINLVINGNGLVNKNVGFSIKSYIGNKPTLLNSSKATNFIYEVTTNGLDINKVNHIKTKNKIRDRILFLINNGASFKFVDIENKVFKNNLRLIDLALPEKLSKLILNFYSGKGSKFDEAIELILNQYSEISGGELIYKIKSFLMSVALGMVPTKNWDGFYNSEGYIVVKNDGDIGCFNVVDKRYLADFLFHNTKFDTPSSSRHDYGYIYNDGNKNYLKLNLQIRF